jgi:hypothetical protein
MAKKVTIKAKPTKAPARSVDDWVAGGNSPASVPAPAVEEAKPEKPATTRYTIDIPTALHAKIKYKCALKGAKMNEEITKLLQRHFGDAD